MTPKEARDIVLPALRMIKEHCTWRDCTNCCFYDPYGSFACALINECPVNWNLPELPETKR